GALPAVAPPDEAAARAALAWLRAEPERLAARRQWAWELTFALRRMRGVATMHHGRWSRHAYDRYVLRLRALLWKRPLEDTVAALAAEGIPCAPAARAAPLFADERVAAALGAEDPRLQPARFPVTQRLAAEWIAIPVPEGGTQREIDDVVAALRKLEAASP
ncbi:MAG: hypothetical protein FJZ92_12155, partial [Chloroflexi bacterium]|nr:hypothetical protein [Chloroflexota bacterium]